MSSLMFLKEKRGGIIKERACAIDTTQHTYIKKEDAAYPSYTMESLFITAGIHVYERCHVATFGVHIAFLHAETDEDVVMRLEGRLAELMVKVDPSLYRKYITTSSKGGPIMYVKIHKALYGMMHIVLLFYCKLVADLEAYGFKIMQEVNTTIVT